MKIRIMVDSSADLIPAVRERVEVLPLTIRFGDEEFFDGVNLTAGEFYKKLAAASALPTTSQVSPFAFEQAYAHALQSADAVVVITLSAALSGTFQSGVIASEAYQGKVFVVDSQNVSLGSGVLVQYALELVDRGMDAAGIAEELTRARERVRLFSVLDTLEYLQKGGRISRTAALAGSILSIKPIITADGGELKLVGKARGSKQANALMNQQIETRGGVDFAKPILMGYSGTSDERLTRYLAESGEFWQNRKFSTTMVGTAVGTYAGPGAVAVAYFTAE